MSGFDLNGLIKKKDIEDEEWRYSPERIATLIRNSAKAQGIKLKAPNPSCKRCNGRGWTGIETATGNPICCRCIFAELPEQEDIPDEYIKPANRAERRKKKHK